MREMPQSQREISRRLGLSTHMVRQSSVDSSRSWWDSPTVILTLDSKRRLTLPASLVAAEPGDHFEAEFDPEEDAVVFRRISRNADWLAVLKACPVKMDDVPPRSREYPKRLKL
jgi:hypothetical protein